MRLTLRQLQIFVAIADTGSTSSAGRSIALSQSATSGALTELESLLAAELFDRIGKRLLLNDNGRLLLPQARQLLDAAQAMETLFQVDNLPGAATRLRIGASTTVGNYLLPALVASFERSRPSAVVDITIDNTRAIAGLVSRLDVDLGLIEGPCHEPDLKVLPWREDELVVVCAPYHPMAELSRQTPLSAAQLRSARWLQREPGSGTREAVEQVLLPHLHHLEQSVQLGSTEAIKQAAVQGMGLACLSRFAVEELLTLQRLVVVPTVLPRLMRRFYLISHPQKRFTAALERFLAHIEPAV